MALRFHWRLLQGGDEDPARGGRRRVAEDAARPDLERQAAFCRDAAAAGIDSLLVDVNVGKPEPLVLALALAGESERVTFMVAHRPGLCSPTLFVQQVNTFSALAGGRLSLNVVAGHSPAEQRAYGDRLAHDERYGRMEELLAVCHAFWDGGAPVELTGAHYRVAGGRLNVPFVGAGRDRPEIYVGGSSEAARRVALRHASCWMRFADVPERIAEEARPLVAAGVEVGVRMSVIVRPTRAEALDAARDLVAAQERSGRRGEERRFVAGSDAVSMRRTFELAADEWLTPTLWTGAVRVFGAPAMALVGTADEVADALLDYAAAGVSQLILAGWPKWDEMILFGREVLPRVREREAALGRSAARRRADRPRRRSVSG